MKKLALALVCFASVAFFASCQQEITNPEPTISVITDEGFVDNDDVVNLEQPIVYGFQMASNSQTKKELKQLSIASYFIDDRWHFLWTNRLRCICGTTTRATATPVSTIASCSPGWRFSEATPPTSLIICGPAAAAGKRASGSFATVI